MTIIVDVRTRVLSIDLHTPFVTALRRTSTIDTVVVEVTDSDGRTGWGEAPQAWRITGDSLAGARACLDGPLADVLRGASVEPRETAPRIASAIVGNHGAKMAADVALHDLAARAAGLPLAEHLATWSGRSDAAGESRTVVPTDVTLAAGEAGALAAAAIDRVAEGFTVLKLKVGTDAQTDLGRVRAVREAVGPDITLRLDANQGWDAVAAVTVVRAIEDAGLDIELVEQPVPAHDLPGLAWVTERVSTPVLADESLFTLADLVEIVRQRAADLVNVKLAKCGGLTAALELLDIAGRHGIGTMVGSMMESHIGVGAAGALWVATGGGRTPDLDAAWWATSSAYDGGVVYDGPTLVLPASPGLGIGGVSGVRG
ncbi:MAG: dipeptide epimerase [Nocardioides sp.]